VLRKLATWLRPIEDIGYIPGISGRSIRAFVGFPDPIVEVTEDLFARWDIERDGLVGLSMRISYKPRPIEWELEEMLRPYRKARRVPSLMWATGRPAYRP
jgi:hypothetical protein